MKTAKSGPARHVRADLALAGIAFIWGATFVVVKEALLDSSTFLFLALRFSLAGIILAAVLRGRLTRKQPVNWVGGVQCAFLLFLGYALQTAGLRLTTASKSAFITGLYIVLVPLGASLVNRSMPRLAEIAGAAAATAGTALMTSGDWDLHLNAGDILTVGCAVAFTAHMLSVAHYTRKMDYERLSLFQVAGVAAFSWLAAATMETPHIAWSPRLLFGVIVTAVLATALSFLLYTWAQQHTSATRAALIFALEPVFAGLTAWVAAGEAWTVRSLTGAGLILSGIVLVEVKPAPPSRHQEG
ncbi:DMT family transporter [Paludibaculum fermentans]|uniref:DMT family transporter n=1 Tax=Paludibaculum fermentans TaxID=1473598 RepID=A0A7S7NMF6_PALFE|nr:DMT family transporter [Paludibaculum fermentans]QOY86328.1 DMT family transporter [Paludibaculum fermentans]